jgi:hypothetical protein
MDWSIEHGAKGIGHKVHKVSVFRFQLLWLYFLTPDTCLPRRSSTERRRDTWNPETWCLEFGILH